MELLENGSSAGRKPRTKAKGVRVEMPTVKEKLTEFEKIPEIKAWLDASDLKPTTREYYCRRLYEFLAGEAPKAFLDRALARPREVGIEIKGKIGAFVQRSPAVAFHVRAALKSFVDFHDLPVKINGRIKVRRKWRKPEIPWTTAEKIIQKCKQPYESVFRFLLWSGVGCDEFKEINESPEIQAEIAAQIKNDKDYVVIHLEPRKQTLTDYFTIVPKKVLPAFPVHSANYKVRGGTLVTRPVLEDNFHSAAKTLGLYQPGFGPHSLRSAFTSQCNMSGVKESVCEFLKGHGSDKYGYAREVLNEEYVVQELRKLWQHAKPVSQEDVKFLIDVFRIDLEDDIKKLNTEKRERIKQILAGRARRLTVRSEKIQVDREIQVDPEIKKIDDETQRKREQLQQLSKAAQRQG